MTRGEFQGFLAGRRVGAVLGAPGQRAGIVASRIDAVVRFSSIKGRQHMRPCQVGSALPWAWFREMFRHSQQQQQRCIHARFFLVGSPPRTRMTRVYVSKCASTGCRVLGPGCEEWATAAGEMRAGGSGSPAVVRAVQTLNDVVYVCNLYYCKRQMRQAERDG